ncbi:hypothetical protein F8388_002533 [Cannabis sativa]|uniref:Uncharacterized protein n=1 Tax=Cannabis sativa TaxID=3483 RepID=A0A7J6I2E2_CANSA|nr:hypothetical protein F8388_002533 [Cannabis sativa]KAF4401259.1 hypothetical protein G4B88_014100 [Cannabis sativa]
MGSKGIGVLLFIFVPQLCVVVFALSSSPLHQHKSSEKGNLEYVFPLKSNSKDKNSRGINTYEHNIKGTDSKNDTSKIAIEHINKIAHGIRRASTGAGGSSTGARPTNPGENGGRGTSTQGGGNYIPVYAAGAANNRHPYHRGAANSNRIQVHTLIVATMASLLQLYGVFRCGLNTN